MHEGVLWTNFPGAKSVGAWRQWAPQRAGTLRASCSKSVVLASAKRARKNRWARILIPHGLYDLAPNEGSVHLNTSSDMSEFCGDSIAHYPPYC